MAAGKWQYISWPITASQWGLVQVCHQEPSFLEKAEFFQDWPTHSPHALQNGLAECFDFGSALRLWKPAHQNEAKPRVVDLGSAVQRYNKLVFKMAGQIFSNHTWDKVKHLSEWVSYWMLLYLLLLVFVCVCVCVSAVYSLWLEHKMCATM